MKINSLIAEAVGTATLIFIGVGAIAADNITGGKLGLTGIALAHGLAIAVMVSATAAVSGGHLNPAVTIGLWSAKKIDSVSAGSYIVAQCVGAAVAAFLVKNCLPVDVVNAISMGTPALGAGITTQMALLTEIILTFFLMFVVFGTAVDSRAPKCGGLFIGLTVALDILMGGPISGAAMNPARFFGPALVGGYWDNAWVYVVGPVLGAVVGAQLYKSVLEK